MSDDPRHPPRSDPLIDEVRAIRRALCDSDGNDVNRLWEHLREVQRRHPGRTVKAPRDTSVAPGS